MSNFRKISDQKEWQSLLNKVLFKTFFHFLAWENFLEKEFKWLKFERYVWRDENSGNDKFLLIVARYSQGGKDYLISHPFCEYGGLLPLNNPLTLNVKGLVQELEKLCDEFKIKFHPKIPKFFNRSRFNLEWLESGLNSYFIEGFDKKTKEEIFESFRKTLKHSIAKAGKSGLEVRKCQTRKELKQFYNLILQKAKEHKAQVLPFSFYQFFMNSPDAEIILAQKGNKIVAGSVFLFYQKHIHYFKNASSKIGSALGANYLILWHSIKKYCHNNSQRGSFEVFDFGGTRVGSSLEIFKMGWGTQRKNIYLLSNQKAPRGAYVSKNSFPRKMWGLLPKTAIKILSPYFLKYKL